MKNLEFSELFRLSGMTMPEAEEALGYSRRQIERYRSGESRRIPKLAVEKLEQIVSGRCGEGRTGGSFRFIDLFAGIGGMRLGFESIGGRCVFTSEWDRFSQQTYRANFPEDCEDGHEFVGDIRPYSENPELIPEHDVLLAGFPCQPFSLAGVSKKNSLGRVHGFACEEQGNLFFEIAKILDHHRPAAFLLENVKHLERHDKGRTFKIIHETLTNDLKYDIAKLVISSEPWVPQKRERVFIVGFRREDKAGFSFDGFKDQVPDEKDWPKLGSIFQTHNEIDSKYTLTPRLWEYLQDYRAKHEEKGNGFGYSLFGPKDVARTLSARYHKDGSEILIRQRGKRPRRLTPVECARLMGFERGDRDWIIPVSDTQAYRQFGNAVVVPVVEAVAKQMHPFLMDVLSGSSAAPHHVNSEGEMRAVANG